MKERERSKGWRKDKNTIRKKWEVQGRRENGKFKEGKKMGSSRKERKWEVRGRRENGKFVEGEKMGSSQKERKWKSL